VTELLEDLTTRTPDRRLASWFETPAPLPARQTVPFSSDTPLDEFLPPTVQAALREALADRSPRQREALDAWQAWRHE